MADELVVLYVGAQVDADQLVSALQGAAIPAHVTRVPTWRALASVSAGWDVVVAGGRHAPARPEDVRHGSAGSVATPVLAVVAPPVPIESASGLVDWFEPEEVGRLLPMLRAIWRASQAEGRERQAASRSDRLEQQLRQTGRLHAIGQMAAGVAHEFNNVLTVISGFCEQLAPKVRGQHDLERLVHPIQQAGVRGAELSQRLLAFSRHQAPAVGDSSLTMVVNEVAAMLVPLLGETISLHLHLDQAVPRVRGHAGALVEVITNLAVNARDAMPAGGAVTIETRMAVPSGPDHEGMVALIVSDTGVGMNQDILARACDPFFTTKDQGDGTGLGLSLVRDLVEQCGGTLTIDSTVGRGTTVTATLPGVRPNDEAVELLTSAETAPPGGFETVLVVEDDAAVREIVTQFLRGAAYLVLEAKDADEAIRVLRQDPRAIDLLVTDIVLPGQSGPELAGTLRELAPQMRTLFISGYPSDSVGGARSPAFLAKPFSRAAFLQAVRRALRAPRHRNIHMAASPGRLSDRERDISEGRVPRGSH